MENSCLVSGERFQPLAQYESFQTPTALQCSPSNFLQSRWRGELFKSSDPEADFTDLLESAFLLERHFPQALAKGKCIVSYRPDAARNGDLSKTAPEKAKLPNVLEPFWETDAFEATAVEKRAVSDILQRASFLERDFSQACALGKRKFLYSLDALRNCHPL